MTLGGIFNPKWENSNSEIRKAAISKINDEEILSEIVKTDQNKDIQLLAFDKIRNKCIIEKVAEQHNDWVIRKIAWSKLGETEKELREVALHSKSWYDVEKIIPKIADQAILAEIARLAEYTKYRNLAIECLKDQKLLGEIALNGVDRHNRISAIHKLEDQNVLSEIALDNDSNIRSEAINRVQDQNVLFRIALSDNDQHNRYKAFQKIKNKDLVKDICEKTKDWKIKKEALHILGDEEQAIYIAALNEKISVTDIQRIEKQDYLREILKSTSDIEIMSIIVPKIADDDFLFEQFDAKESVDVKILILEHLSNTRRIYIGENNSDWFIRHKAFLLAGEETRAYEEEEKEWIFLELNPRDYYGHQDKDKTSKIKTQKLIAEALIEEVNPTYTEYSKMYHFQKLIWKLSDEYLIKVAVNAECSLIRNAAFVKIKDPQNINKKDIKDLISSLSFTPEVAGKFIEIARNLPEIIIPHWDELKQTINSIPVYKTEKVYLSSEEGYVDLSTNEVAYYLSFPELPEKFKI